MTAPLKAIDGNADLPALMTELALRARAAARVLALASPEQKNRALDAIAQAFAPTHRRFSRPMPRTWLKFAPVARRRPSSIA